MWCLITSNTELTFYSVLFACHIFLVHHFPNHFMSCSRMSFHNIVLTQSALQFLPASNILNSEHFSLSNPREIIIGLWKKKPILSPSVFLDCYSFYNWIVGLKIGTHVHEKWDQVSLSDTFSFHSWRLFVSSWEDARSIHKESLGLKMKEFIFTYKDNNLDDKDPHISRTCLYCSTDLMNISWTVFDVY